MTPFDVPVAAVRKAQAAAAPVLRRVARPPRPVHQGHAPSAQAPPATRYMPALDGLRAIAVLAVIAYHVNAGWASGGMLGVGVFFVLSGYLITDLLTSQFDRMGHIDLKDFWSRRARRLLPALWAMLLVVTAYISLFDRGQLAALRGDLLAAVLYVSNWWLTFHHVSYFASFGPPSPLGHLWSLAVEEQFYLLWPLLLALGLRLPYRRRAWLALPTLALAAASALAMALIYEPGSDPSRVYYGTDTRAFALLIGAALAMLLPSGRLAQTISRRRALLFDAVGMLGLATLLVMFWRTNEYQTFLYPTGLVLLSMASAVLVAALAQPQTVLSRLLAWEPLRWLGVRSYGIYLWHYPVIILTTPLIDSETFGPWRALLQVSASIVLAALSWRYIEAPIRTGALARTWQALRKGWAGEMWRRATIPQRAASLAGGAIALVAAGGVAGLVPAAAFASRPPAHVAVASIVSTPWSAPSPLVLRPAQISAPAPTPGGGSGGGPVVQPLRPPTTTPPSPGRSATACTSVTAIGDSIMVDATPYLKALLPDAYVDGLVGRQLYQAQATVDQLKAQGHLGTCVIIELGTNGPFTRAQLVALLQSLGHPRRIVLVNTRVPRPWQTVVNQTLASVAAEYPHTVLVNWFALSANKASYFWPDGVHLDPAGARWYASLLARAVEHGSTAR